MILAVIILCVSVVGNVLLGVMLLGAHDMHRDLMAEELLLRARIAVMEEQLVMAQTYCADEGF